MIGWLIETIVFSSGVGPPAEPRTVSEAADRFFFRSLAVAFGFALLAGGGLTAWLAQSAHIRGAGQVAVALGILIVLTGLLRLVHLWRAARTLRRARADKMVGASRGLDE